MSGRTLRTPYPGNALQDDEIRVIRLLPDSWSNPIRCELIHVRLRDRPFYEALSYVWGSPKKNKTILLDGEAFPATLNLVDALQHLRHTHEKGLVLWVDALCINQKDERERTHQVDLMGQIYSSCRRVIVYLGDGLGGTKKPQPSKIRFYNNRSDLRLAENFEERCDLESFNVFCFLRLLAQDQHLDAIPLLRSPALITDNERVKQLEMLRRLMHPPWTPWWSRIWVIQEIAMPKDAAVFCGSMSAPWSMFAQAASNLAKHSGSCCASTVEALPRDQVSVLTDFSNRVGDIEELRCSFLNGSSVTLRHRTSPNQQPLLALLRRFRDRRASDPRDKVYALLSMVPSESTVAMMTTPDYSLSEVEVFRRATLDVICFSQSLAVLSTDLGRKFRNDLPSWVPDWAAPGSSTHNIRAEAVELYNYWSGQEANLFSFEVIGETVLVVEAAYLGHIVELGEVMWGDSASGCQSTLRNWCAALKRHEFKAEPMSQRDFWRFLCADVICLQTPTNAKPKVRRTSTEDEITFVSWAMKSKRSPFNQSLNRLRLSDLLLYGYAGIAHHVLPPPDSEDCSLVRSLTDLARLWLYLLRLETLTSYGYSSVPDVSGAIEKVIDGWKNLYPPDKMLGNGMVWKSEVIRQVRDRWVVPGSGKIQEDAPWKEFLEDMVRRLSEEYGTSFNLNVDPKLREEEVATMDFSIISATLSRRLILTTNDYVGLGPADAQVGDKVYLIKWGKMPFVLRFPYPVGAEGQIVGDCYIQGLMDPSRDRVKVRWKKIRIV